MRCFRVLMAAVLVGGSISVALPTPPAGAVPHVLIRLVPLGAFETGEEAGTEIAAFDPDTARMFTTNGAHNRIDVVDLADPNQPALVTSIDLTPYGAGVQSVDVAGGLGAAAVQADPKSAPGSIVFFDAATAEVLRVVTVGALPDMVTFTPNGRRLLVANEGEPDCTEDQAPEDAANPEGSDPAVLGIGDVSPEGMHFVAADDSPTGRALLIVAHEFSGSTRIFEIRA
ncbi:MAG: choice-of-anchor I domain-containing protein [Acidimicrobiales bacterium]